MTMRTSSIFVLVIIFPIIIASSSKVQDEGRKQEATPFFSQGVRATVDGQDTMTVVQSGQRGLEQEKTNKINKRERKRSLRSRAFQPDITVIERKPSRMGFNSISNPKGTPWCGGNPTYWIVGHQREDAPVCLVNGIWEVNETSKMDKGDEMNGWTGIDRHACVTMDVNKDGIADIICSTGGGKGEGVGYTELYFTQENGTLFKIQKDHGLQEYPTMSNRYTVVLKNRQKEKEFVFFATQLGERTDGQTNAHRMFRNVFEEEGTLPYFEEVKGPWLQPITEATCAVAGDFTHDRLDDLVMCVKDGPPLFVRQVRKNRKTSFEQVDLPKLDYLQEWSNVRIANVTGGALNDLVVVTLGQPSKLYIFQGQRESPYFRFDEIYYEATFEWGSPDFDILDVNNDNIPDIYVIQTSENKTTYCGSLGAPWWGGSGYPPDNFIPPRDEAHDVLLLGNRKNKEQQFTQVEMLHELPGCGFIAQRWDDKTMLLGQGDWGHVGYSLLLEW